MQIQPHIEMQYEERVTAGIGLLLELFIIPNDERVAFSMFWK